MGHKAAPCCKLKYLIVNILWHCTNILLYIKISTIHWQIKGIQYTFKKLGLAAFWGGGGVSTFEGPLPTGLQVYALLGSESRCWSHTMALLDGHPVLSLPGIRSLPLHRWTISRNFCTCWWYGHFRESNLDVAVNQQDSVCTIIIKNLGHGVYIYMVASAPALWPSISSFKKVDMVLPIIRLKTSLTPIGRIPKFLSSGISVQEG